MTRARVAAAIAAVLTALLLQATLVAPITMPVQVSLPAVLIAAVALAEGPGVGIGLGFGTGLLADLASRHPAGTLALVWMGLGLACGVFAEPGTFRHVSIRSHALIAAIACTGATTVATIALTVLGADGASLGQAVEHLVPTLLGDALLALAIVPVVRFFLRHHVLQAPHAPMLDLTATLR